MNKRLRLFFLLLLLLPLKGMAVIESYEFADDQQRLRFQQLTDELRCPKCQNQNIADSNAPIAADLRREIHRMLNERRSDDEIINFMSSRYGDFVLYKPRLTPQTFLLWYGPPALLIFGLVMAGLVVRHYKSSQQRQENCPEDLTVEQQQRLQALLGQQPKERK
jgi:cytochrome c-type biogenesis protein CcmH